MGNSREPPVYPEVFQWLSRLPVLFRDTIKNRVVTRRTLKRLPRGTHHSSASQARQRSTADLFQPPMKIP
jgi:hypothetical protein